MGRYNAGLVGESKYQPAIKRRYVGEEVFLEPEPENKHDSNAIRAVCSTGETIGYVERDSWLTRCIIDEKGTVAARIKEIVGGGRGRSLGVVIDVFTGREAVEELERRQNRAGGIIQKFLGRLFKA